MDEAMLHAIRNKKRSEAGPLGQAQESETNQVAKDNEKIFNAKSSGKDSGGEDGETTRAGYGGYAPYRDGKQGKNYLDLAKDKSKEK